MKKLAITLSILLFLSANAAEFSANDAQRFSAYYSNGLEYLKNQQYTSAINEFRKVLRFSPYDDTIKDALINAYMARAQHYKQTTKEYKKALNDYKSAYFYAKYWSKTQSNPQLITGAKGEINNLESRLQIASTPQSRFQNAKFLKAQGELAASGYDFQQLKNSTYKEQVYENLSNIYKNLNNVMFGLDYIKTAIDINPKNPKTHFLYGVMLDEANNYEAAIEQYNLAFEYGDKSPELLEILENKWTQNIVNNPTDAQGYINLGAIYQKTGNLEGARAQYLKATQMNPNDTVAFYNLASLYIQQNNYPAAISVYDQLLAKNPKNIEVLEYKAQAYKKLNKFEQALHQYQLILAIDPNNKEAKAQSDDIIFNNFTGAKLEQYLLTKAQQEPNSYEAQFNYALEMHKNKKYPEAINYYNKALQLNPSKEETYINLAQIYLEQKNYPQASAIAQKGLLVLPNNAQLIGYLNDSKNYSINEQFNQAGQLFEQRKFPEAINEYLKIENKTVEVNMAIASAYFELEDYKNANNYFLKVLAAEPNNLDALVSSAWAYYSLKDDKNARQVANKVLALDKTNKSAQDILTALNENEFANLLDSIAKMYEKGDYNSCLNLALKALKQNPDNDFALYYKALSLDNKEQYREAIDAYEKLLSVKGAQKDEMSEFATSRIKELKDYLNQLNGK